MYCEWISLATIARLFPFAPDQDSVRVSLVRVFPLIYSSAGLIPVLRNRTWLMGGKRREAYTWRDQALHQPSCTLLARRL